MLHVRRVNRFHGFLIVSAALVGGVVVLAGVLVGSFFERYVLAQEEAQTAAMVQNQARQHLSARDFDPLAAGPSASFPVFLEGLPGVFRIKVFDVTGRIIWSNEPRLIGLAFPDSPYLRAALGGRVTMVLEAPKRAEHVFEQGRGYIAEAYVPIAVAGSAEVGGVIETYKDMTAVVGGIRSTQRRIWAVGGSMGLFLYCALAFVVWKASVNELRAITAIREAHERLAAILAGVADQMVIVDRRMRVVWMNAAAADAMGEGAIGRPCFELIGSPGEACEGCPAIRTLLSGTVERGVRARAGPGGKMTYLDLITAPLRDASGAVHQVLEVSRDITELVEMEERLKQSNQALLDTQAQLVEKERLAAVGQVVVGLHHAILNPLTGILGALHVLKQTPSETPEQTRAIAEAEAEVRKIERLVRHLSDLRGTPMTPYVGGTTMLDLDRPSDDDESAGKGGA